MDEAKEKKNVIQRFKKLPKNKKIQLSIAAFLSLMLIILLPVYAWFNYQREIARLERIKSPDMLYITAANREDKININMNNIDVNSAWNSTSTEKATYQYFVFAVAGQYVTNYNLQLAHTKNNNFKYEIFEAEASNTNPSILDSNKIEGKDYIIYEPNDSRIPADLHEIGTHDGINTNQSIFYSIKEVDGTPVSLSDSPYNGAYLNMSTGSEYTALATDEYHDQTYEYENTEEHSEPLYWQCTNIPVEDTNNDRAPFYHEYILKVSWDPARIGDLEKKDTDIVYITASVK